MYFQFHKEDRKIRARLISIQDMLTPHLEVMQRHLQSAKELVKRDPNLYIEDNMYDLVEKLKVKIKELESIQTSWDNTLEMILQIHKPFFGEERFKT